MKWPKIHIHPEKWFGPSAKKCIKLLVVVVAVVIVDIINVAVFTK